MPLTALFEEATQRKASDLHLATGEIPRLRIAGELVRMDLDPLDASAFDRLMQEALTPDTMARMELGLPVERTVTYGDRAFAGVFFRFGDDGMGATFRVLMDSIPPLEVIGEGAQPLFQRITQTPRGLVLVTGPTGSGKWTTACSIMNRINEEKAARIFVVEAHPNYRYSSKRGLVTPIPVGPNIDSYAGALQVAQHADLDVLVIDDVPTVEVLRSLLILAETGHLVVANMHSDGAIDAVRRLLESAGPDAEALRRSLALNLIAVTGQRLFPRKSEKGRVPGYEWISATAAVRQALLNGDLNALEAAQATDADCRTAKAAVQSLVEAGELDPAIAAGT